MTPDNVRTEFGVTADAWMQSSEWLTALAFHEAGHACVALSLGIEVFYSTIRPKFDSAGHTRISHAGLSIESGVLLTLGGPAAQRRHFPLAAQFSDDLEDDMGRFDTRQAIALLRALHGTDHTRCVADELARWRQRAARTVDMHWPWISAVADRLVQQQRLTGSEIATLRPRHGYAR